MASEGEPPQQALFTSELLETPTSYREALPSEDRVERLAEHDIPAALPIVSELSLPEPQLPKATFREMRAVRSLLYNRLLLEVIQRRIEKAEAIILSFLLTQEEAGAQIGPYLVEVDAANHICLTRTETDDWHQMYFPELEMAPAP